MFHIIFFFSCKLFILDIDIRPVLLPMLEVMERGEALLVPSLATVGHRTAGRRVLTRLPPIGALGTYVDTGNRGQSKFKLLKLPRWYTVVEHFSGLAAPMFLNLPGFQFLGYVSPRLRAQMPN